MASARIVRRCFAVSACLLTLFASVTWFPGRAAACPFCGAASLTLSEQVAVADALVLVQWVSGVKEDKGKPGTTTLEVLQKVKGPASVTKGNRITLDRYRSAKPGELFILLGTKGESVDWGSPIETTETGFNYIAQAPSSEAAPSKRLAYFLKFLENSDPVIANDAFAEFANSPYKEVAGLKEILPHDRLRKWVTSPDVTVTRLGLYGMMLGLCGDETDRKILESKILESTEDFRLGIDGIMYGYLLLAGDPGLTVIDQNKLSNKKVPFSETFAAMTALRYMWQYGENRISHDRLRQSMRILLDRPELADLVIADLARWKDWSVQEQLMSLYGTDEYNVPSIKRAIVRYLLVSTKTPPAGAEDETPQQVRETGKRLLDELRAKDPKTVAEAEKFFTIP